MDYKNGIIVQFKNEEHLIRNLKWNKEYAKIVSNEIGIIEEKGSYYYKIRLIEDKSVIVMTTDDAIFVPNGYLIREE